ncbi:hypothetical protein LA080_000812 [Diaporthe eres]|nr:hypothetical protein LA080_000812 [Diaporthe eres]
MTNASLRQQSSLFRDLHESKFIMRPAKCLPPLVLLAEASYAMYPVCSHGDPDCESSGLSIEAGEWIGSFTGLVFISKTLWLETIHSDSHTAAKAGESIIRDMKTGSDALLMLAVSVHYRESAPFDFSQVDEAFFTGFQAWTMQTTNFLISLARSAGMFREADPRLGPALAS